MLRDALAVFLVPRRAEILTVAMLALVFFVPLISDDLFLFSLLEQILIAFVASLSVFVMLRMDLLSFATPAFMAIGGYAVAIASLSGLSDVLLLTLISALAPALVALPLGALVLRLRGTYFVLVTFVVTEIMQLLLFSLPAVTGGANGIAGIPSPMLLDIPLSDNRAVLYLADGLAILAALATATLQRGFGEHFAAIRENEVLAQSLGLSVQRYKLLGFVGAAALGGLGGFALVNMLLTAHPSSFTATAAVNYIAYAIIGGQASMLGPMIGSAALVTASNIFGAQGRYAQGLYGLLIMVVALVAKGGIVGALASPPRRVRPAAPQVSELAPAEVTEPTSR